MPDEPLLHRMIITAGAGPPEESLYRNGALNGLRRIVANIPRWNSRDYYGISVNVWAELLGCPAGCLWRRCSVMMTAVQCCEPCAMCVIEGAIMCLCAPMHHAA